MLLLTERLSGHALLFFCYFLGRYEDTAAQGFEETVAAFASVLARAADGIDAIKTAFFYLGMCMLLV